MRRRAMSVLISSHGRHLLIRRTSHHRGMLVRINSRGKLLPLPSLPFSSRSIRALQAPTSKRGTRPQRTTRRHRSSTVTSVRITIPRMLRAHRRILPPVRVTSGLDNKRGIRSPRRVRPTSNRSTSKVPLARGRALGIPLVTSRVSNSLRRLLQTRVNLGQRTSVLTSTRGARTHSRFLITRMRRHPMVLTSHNRPNRPSAVRATSSSRGRLIRRLINNPVHTR
jgi:hypothetical protein